MTVLSPSTPSRPVAHHAPGGRGHYGPAAVLRSEWTKLRSVRSTTWSLAATVLLTVGIGILATGTEASRWAHASLRDRLTFDPTSLSLTGLIFGQLAIGVLGILVISAEYGTGSIRSTFAAVPNRPLVLAAKAIVFTAVSTVIGVAVSFIAFFVGQAILTGTTPHAAIGDPGVLRAVVGGGLYLAVLGLLALGLATMIRHTAGSISAFVGVLFILPLIVEALPSSIRDAVGKYLPANIGATMTTVHPGFRSDIPTFSPWVGFAILCGYAALALALGCWLLVRRDA
jgi:ABC-2 type transport system permease protein